jgi:glutathione S-transferase
MKLVNSIGPNPKVVRMFMAELGVSCEIEDIDIMAGENRQEVHLSRNPSGQAPALELDNGAWIAEITAICEYLDDKAGGTDLIGTTPEARAETRMWCRRIDLQILEPLANGFRFSEGLPLFQDRLHCIPAAAADLKETAQERITWLDSQIAGKSFVCGDRFTLADILLFVFMEFGVSVGQPLNEENKNIMSWYASVQSRESASA